MTGPSKPEGALAGLRVVDLSRFIAGPTCGMILADMGADVVKVEKPGKGEVTRANEPKLGGTSVYSIVHNRNKRSLALDTRSAEGLAVLRELIAKADIVIENFRPGIMEKMGCGWDELSRSNPRLIMARISGFGQDGPYAHRPALDRVLQAMSGLMDLTGPADREPHLAGTYITDYTTALYAAIGILSALEARHRTGTGQVVDVALLDSALSLLCTAIAEYDAFGTQLTRNGNIDRFAPSSDIYRTRDGDWLQLAVGGEAMFPRFMRAIGREDVIADPRFASMTSRLDNGPEQRAIIGEWIAAHGTEEALAVIEKADVPVAKVATIADVVGNPQVRHRGQIVQVDQPGHGKVAIQGSPIRLSHSPLANRGGLPPVGAHSEEVLREWLDIGETRLSALRGGNII